VIENLPSKQEALNSISSTTKPNKQDKLRSVPFQAVVQTLSEKVYLEAQNGGLHGEYWMVDSVMGNTGSRLRWYRQVSKALLWRV
jgi:hypothetical protein